MGCGASAQPDSTPVDEPPPKSEPEPPEEPPPPIEAVWGQTIPSGARWQYYLELKQCWTDSGDEEDAALKAAYQKGEKTVQYTSYGVEFDASFAWMRRFNLGSKKSRPLRLADGAGMPVILVDKVEPEPIEEEQPDINLLDGVSTSGVLGPPILLRTISEPPAHISLKRIESHQSQPELRQCNAAGYVSGPIVLHDKGNRSWAKLQKQLDEESKESQEALARLLIEYPDVVCIWHPARPLLRLARRSACDRDYGKCLAHIQKATSICEEERQGIMNAFLQIDTDGDFRLSADEVSQLCDMLGAIEGNRAAHRATDTAECLMREAKLVEGTLTLEAFSQWVAQKGGVRRLGLGIMQPPSCACPTCGHSFIQLPGESGDIEGHKNLPKGATMTKEEALEHASENRLRCPVCEESWCAHCDATPYHFGLDCAAWAERAERMNMCRFCGDEVTPGQMSCGSTEGSDPLGQPPTLSCADKECRACTESNDCGHPCGGVLGEETCLPCLMEGCHGPELPDADDFCNICWVEALGSAPSVQMACGHIFHHHCAQAVINSCYKVGKALNFTSIHCPLCRQQFDTPSLSDALAPHIERYQKVRRLAISRHRNEKRPGHDADDDSVAADAMVHMRFFLCFECKEPYYGGEAACGDGAAEQEAAVVAGAVEEEFVCGACIAKKFRTSTCEEHGTEFIGWKCKFCCEFQSSFFCHGHTHFCDRCHRWGFGAKDHPEVFPCKGGSECVFGGKHPENCLLNSESAKLPNGEGEYPLGCVICLRAKAW